MVPEKLVSAIPVIV